MTLPVGFAATVLGLTLFVLDSFTVTDGAASILYVAVLVLPAGLWQKRGVMAVAVLCAVMTVMTYFLAHGFTLMGNGLFRRAVSVGAIAVATLLVLKSLVESNKLAEQTRLLDLTDDAILVHNADDIITFWNHGAEKLYGWSSREALGQSASTLLKTGFPVPRAAIVASLAERGRWEGELVNTTRRGARVIVASRWAPQSNRHGEVLGILQTSTDVTRRRAADRAIRHSEERYRAIFRSAGVAIWEEDFSRVMPKIEELRARGIRDIAQFCVMNPDFVRDCVRLVRLVDVNDSAIRMFEAERKEDLLQSLERIYLPGTTGSFAKIMIALAEGAASCESETHVRSLRGRPMTIHMSITFQSPPERLSGVLVSIMDVTERGRARDSMILARESLARVTRISTLGEVTASIAHEVNQPLAAIITNAEACLRWLRRPVPDMDEAGEAMERVIRDGERATEVVARIRSFLGKMPLQRAPFSCAEIIEEASRLVRGEMLQQGVSLHLDLGASLPPIMGDRLQIEQVILNLLVNAIQAMAATPAESRALTVRVAMHGDRDIIVQVRDTGGGIAPEELRALFQPFFTTKEDGMGLGLTICRSIILAHGGHIWATSQIAHGTTVQFTLPTEARALSRSDMATA